MPKTPCPEDAMMDEEEEKENMKLVTPRKKMGSNDANNTPKEIRSTKCVQHKDK